MLVVRPAPALTLCLDTATPLGDTALQAAAQRGVEAILTYLDLLKKGVVERYCATRTLRGGTMGVGFILYSRKKGWQPTGATGEVDGRDALSRLADLAIPIGPTIWDDWETPAPDTMPEDAMAHLDAESRPIHTAQFSAGVYIGKDPILTGSEFYERGWLTRYGLSASDVRDRNNNPVVPSPRGYCWLQRNPLDDVLPNSGAVTVDYGVLSPDWHGGSAMLVYQG